MKTLACSSLWRHSRAPRRRQRRKRGPSACTSASTAHSRPTTQRLQRSVRVRDEPGDRVDARSTTRSGRVRLRRRRRLPALEEPRGGRRGLVLHARRMRPATTSSVPHPFFFNQPREVSGDATGVKRTETAVHVQGDVPRRSRGNRCASCCPAGRRSSPSSRISSREVRSTETYPVRHRRHSRSARKTERKGSAAAFNVGADVMWMLTQAVRRRRAGPLLAASVDLDAPGNRTISVDAGGVYAGGGIRHGSSERFRHMPTCSIDIQLYARACWRSCAGSRRAASQPTATSPPRPAGRARPGRSAISCATARRGTFPPPGHRRRPAGWAATAAVSEMKRALLRAEGVLVSGERIRDFRARRWPKSATNTAKNKAK